MPKLPAVTGKKMIAFLHQTEGYETTRSRGSHFILKHKERGLFTTVPVHGNETLRPGTLLGILSDIDMTKEEFCEKFSK